MQIDNPYGDANWSGTWYRGVLDIHPGDDGNARALRYRDRGFDFIGFSESNELIVPTDIAREDFLILPGAEVGKAPVTLVGLNELVPTLAGSWTLAESLAFGAEHQTFTVIDHPMRSCLSPIDLEGAGGYQAIDVFNSSGETASDCCADQFWDMLLRRGYRIWGVAGNNMQKVTEMGRGSIYLQAEELSEEAILQALFAGRFYASAGPRIRNLTITEDGISLECSPAVRVEFITGNGQGEVILPVGALVDTALFSFKEEDGSPRDFGHYVRVMIEGADGHRAWTNPIGFPDVQALRPPKASTVASAPKPPAPAPAPKRKLKNRKRK